MEEAMEKAALFPDNLRELQIIGVTLWRI